MTNKFSLEEFISNFDGGAKSYLFEWVPQLTASMLVLLKFNLDPSYFVRAASLPGCDIEEMPSYYKGWEARWPGAKRFTDWTVSFNMDKDGNLRRFFEIWMGMISEPALLGTYGDVWLYESIQRFSQLGPNDSTGELETQLTYEIVGAWPKNLGPATMDYSSTDVTQFDVTFSYLYHLTPDILDIF